MDVKVDITFFDDDVVVANADDNNGTTIHCSGVSLTMSHSQIDNLYAELSEYLKDATK